MNSTCRPLMCVIAMVVAFSPVFAEAGGCKPNFKGKDRMTKVEFAEWTQGLYKPRFLAADSPSEINIAASVMRAGEANTVNIILEKKVADEGQGLGASLYKAEKGNEFLFGFKEGGEPLRFVADAVFNDTRAEMIGGNLATKVVLTAHVKDDDLAALKAALANKQIDAVRVSLANSLTIEQSVNEDNGEAFMEKIQCWLAFQETKPSP